MAGAAGTAVGRAQCAGGPVRRPRLRPARLLRRSRRSDPHAPHRPPRRAGVALPELPHHRPVQPEPGGAADGTQPPQRGGGDDHGTGDGLSRLQRPHPQGHRDAPRRAGRAGLRHHGARQVAPHAGRARVAGRPVRPVPARSGLRAVLRVPRRRDLAVGARPLGGQPPGAGSRPPRGRLPPQRGPRRPRHRVDQHPEGRGAEQAVLHLPRLRRDALAPSRPTRVHRRVPRRVRRRLGRDPARDAGASGRDGARAAGHHPARPQPRRAGVGRADGRRAATVRPPDGGVRRHAHPHRRPDRPARRLPRTQRAARRHAADGDERQRRERRGCRRRPARLVRLRQRRTRLDRDDAGAPRRLGLAAHASALRVGVGDGRQHPEPDVQGVRPRGRHPRPAGGVVAVADRRRRFGPHPVPPHRRHRADRPRGDRPRLARHRARARTAPGGGDEPALQPHRADGADDEADPVLRDVRAPRHLGRRVEGSRAALVAGDARPARPDRPRDARRRLRCRPVGVVPPRRRHLRDARPRRRAPREAARAGRAVVGRGRAPPGAAARRLVAGAAARRPAAGVRTARGLQLHRTRSASPDRAHRCCATVRTRSARTSTCRRAPRA